MQSKDIMWESSPKEVVFRNVKHSQSTQGVREDGEKKRSKDGALEHFQLFRIQ